MSINLFFCLVLNSIIRVHCFRALLPEFNIKIKPLFKNLPEHKLVYHYDKSKLDLLDKFMEYNRDDYNEIITFYYDNDIKISRFPGYHYVNIVLLNDTDVFTRFINMPNNLQYYDLVFFYVEEHLNETEIRKLFLKPNLQKAGVIFYNHLGTDVYYYVHYFKNVSMKIKTVQRKVLLETYNFPAAFTNEFLNFERYKFKTVFGLCPPYTLRETLPNGNKIAAGIEISILKLLAKKLNFKIDIYIVLPEIFGEYVWAEMILMVHNGTYDIGFGCVSQDENRTKLVDFSTYLHVAKYNSIFYKYKDIISRDALIETFDWISWLFFFMSCSVMNSFLYFNDKRRGVRNSLFLTIHFSVSDLIEQSSQKYIKESAGLLAFSVIIWKLMCVALSNTFKSKLAATMIRPILDDPDTIQELIDREYIFQRIVDDIMLQYVLETYNGISKPVKVDFNFTHSEICKAIANMISKPEKITTAANIKTIYYDLIHTCKNIISFEDLARLRLIKEDIFVNIHAWILTNGAPYNSRFSETIDSLRENGILSKWYEEDSINMIVSNSKAAADFVPKTLKIEHIFGHLVVLVTGLILSAIVFILEISLRRKN